MPPHVTVTNIRQAITDVVNTWRPMIESKGILLTSFIDENLHDESLIDSRKFQMCLNTLLSNAAHYTNAGRVHIHVTATQAIGSEAQDLKIIVLDTGKGMSENEQTAVLDSDNGSRLSETKRYAQDMGGDMQLISNLGRGSEFILTCQSNAAMALNSDTNDISEAAADLDELVDIIIEPDDIPIHAADVIELEDIEDVKFDDFNPDNLNGLRVLIVDDIASNHDVIKLFLAPESCECLCVDTGEQALETLKTQNVDIILMDIRMPGMNGIEATQKIRGNDADTPIIALTADGSAQTNAACMSAGADLFLTKPVLRRDLIESIRFVRRYKDDQKNLISAA